MTTPANTKQGSAKELTDQRSGAFAKYQKLVVGRPGFLAFLKFELITGLFGNTPGALGLFLRKKFYPCLFASCGRGVVFGPFITLRCPGRIHIGANTIISENTTLDAKGSAGDGIRIGAGVFIAKGTIVATGGGTLVVDDGTNIGAYCRIATTGDSHIGPKALLSSYCYIVGADHVTDDPNIAVLDQPTVSRGGASVGEGTWLGAKVTVADGAKVGRHCIIGAHALVLGDIPDHSVAVGIPAKVVRNRLTTPVA